MSNPLAINEHSQWNYRVTFFPISTGCRGIGGVQMTMDCSLPIIPWHLLNEGVCRSCLSKVSTS